MAGKGFAAKEPKNKAEFVRLTDSIAADVLAAIVDSLKASPGAPQPKKLLNFDLDGQDFIGIFATASGDRFSFRLSETDVLYSPVTR